MGETPAAIRNELREIKYNAENDRRNVRSQFENLVATNASQLGDIGADGGPRRYSGNVAWRPLWILGRAHQQFGRAGRLTRGADRLTRRANELTRRRNGQAG